MERFDALETGVSTKAARNWQQRRSRELMLADALMIGIALVVAYTVRFGDVGDVSPLRYRFVALGIMALWLAVLAYQRVYEARLLGIGTEEFRRVTTATFQTFGAVAIVSYLLKLEVARGFVAVAMPLGYLLLLVVRFAMRRRLQGSRRRGFDLHRVLALGEPEAVASLAAQMRRDPHAGFVVVAGLVPDRDDPATRPSGGVPFVRSRDVVAAAREVRADTVAVTTSAAQQADRVRRLAWALEGSDLDLVLAPSITDVAGPRITVRPVAGLPLVYVDEPAFTGGRRVVKRGLDLVGAGIGLLILSPLLLAVALVIRTTSPGPVLFRQPRTGKDGQLFACWKFRTMYLDAEARAHELATQSHADGHLFKVKDDPRITGVGGFLRRTSLDELPQLVNVVRGEMSLVGPRPLAVDDAAFQGDERRRLLVRPGITGLWQVAGRETQSWEEAVRLDLYYVENWSLAFDIAILLRTLLAVVRGSGD